jgi:hypothetical protein
MARHLLCSLSINLTIPVREEAKMKYLVIALLSCPVALAYELRPMEMREALVQALNFVLLHITS